MKEHLLKPRNLALFFFFLSYLNISVKSIFQNFETEVKQDKFFSVQKQAREKSSLKNFSPKN